MPPFNFHNRSETFDPFEDEKPVEIEFNNTISRYVISGQMPDGLVERAENENLSRDDNLFFAWMLEEYTNWEVDDINEKGMAEHFAYIINLVAACVTQEDVSEWEEFKQGEEDSSFVDSGTLGVQ